MVLQGCTLRRSRRPRRTRCGHSCQTAARSYTWRRLPPPTTHPQTSLQKKVEPNVQKNISIDVLILQGPPFALLLLEHKNPNIGRPTGTMNPPPPSILSPPLPLACRPVMFNNCRNTALENCIVITISSNDLPKSGRLYVNLALHAGRWEPPVPCCI